jgi:hypothetical protein
VAAFDLVEVGGLVLIPLALAFPLLLGVSPPFKLKIHTPTATPTRRTTTAMTIPTMAPVLKLLLLACGAGVGLMVRLAGVTTTAALDTTAQLGMEELANCVLMFETVKAAAVAVA